MKRAITILSLVFIFMSCNIVNQLTGLLTLSQCEYKYNNISNIQLAGMNLGSGSSISLANFAAISTIFTRGSQEAIPFSLTLSIDVINPNATAALLSALDYDIQINDLQLVSGKMDTPLKVEAGDKSTLPITVGLDLRSLINQYSQDKVSKELSGFLGLSSEPTKVKVNIWPKLTVGNTPIKVPAAIPIEFSFGGKK